MNGNVTAIASDTSLTLDSSATIAAETPYTITPVAGASDRVTTWIDQSGNGNSPTQATASKKPSQKLAGQNGLPVVRFDGPFTSGNDILKASFTLIQPETVFAAGVWRFPDIAGDTFFDGANINLMRLYRPNSNTSVVQYAGAGASITVNNLNWHVYALVYNGVSSSQSVDNSIPTVADAGVGGAQGLSINAVGTDAEYGGIDLGEILVYSAALNVAQQAQLNAYLRSRWGTP